MRVGVGAVLAGGVAAAVGLTGVPALDLRRVAPVASTDGTRPASTVAATRTDLVCPGPETIGVRGTDAVGTAPAASLVTAAAVPASLAPQGLPAAAGLVLRSLPGQALAADLVPGTTGAVRSARAATSAAAGVSVQATGAAAAGLVADQWTLVRQGDLRGLATAPCRPGSADTGWSAAAANRAGAGGWCW
ncbi:hypothetical protein GCM10025868_36760 [Angustibacter aerolatus]|uniref:SAF domain-containing protein n=1 Tax=Angustibacter aerolatus TaxID=1162965 RepID=A0ABQ6JLJ7_9ACTN|nr:hypothetical protein GCM10025868_36760 [Angustibacter aerolatus]